MITKQFAKSFFRWFGFDIVRYVPECDHPFDVLSLVVRHYLSQSQDFFFIQIGAHDGVLDDPLRDLVLAHRLPGLFVEPLPNVFEKLRRNYTNQTQLIFENAAISDEEGHATIYRIKNDAPVPEYWHGLANFDKKHLLKQDVPESYIVECAVKTTTLPILL